jgi:hypothetical protein
MGQEPNPRGLVPRPRVSSLTLEQFLRAYPRMAGADGEGGEGSSGGEGGSQGSQEGQGGQQQARTFDESYVKQLRGEAAGHRTKVGELEARLKEFEDRDKSDLEKATGERDSLKAERDSLQSQVAKFQIAAKAGLPVEHAHRISGSTDKEMEEDAKKLAAAFGGGNGTSGGFDGGARGGGDQPLTMDQQIRRAAGRG